MAEKDNKQEIKPGMTVKVHERIKELNAKGEEKSRIQIFEGLVVAIKSPKTAGGTMTIRKISEGVGVEKIFPISSPLVEKIDIIKEAKVRRAKLFYVRDNKKKLKEKKA